VKPKSFKASLERGGGSLNWTIIRIPFDAAKLWGSRGHIRVKGEINGFAFRTSLFPAGAGDHVMIVNKGMQKGAKTKLGDIAQFCMEPDTAKRVVIMPPEMESILKEDAALRRWFGQISESHRSQIGKWIVEVKSSEARVRRAEQLAERILNTMEAERELPPALRIAFANDPIAHAEWQKLSPAQRRNYLFAIFYYRDPGSRTRRTRKVFEELRAKRR
jgi:uncharacterized protein YdeI (YjbR/CyaY-like superfamily)